MTLAEILLYVYIASVVMVLVLCVYDVRRAGYLELGELAKILIGSFLPIANTCLAVVALLNFFTIAVDWNKEIWRKK